MKIGRILLAAITMVSMAAADESAWLREVEITAHELRDDGQQDFTVRFLPAQNHEVAILQFECVYHQTFPWENLRGKRYMKVHEPVAFPYQRTQVKFVNDLDNFVSFRVPLGHDRLAAAYGETVFNKAFPVTISRMKITALSAGKPLWTCTVKVGQAWRPGADPNQDQADKTASP